MVQKELGIRSERSDDIPLIIHWLTEMRIVEQIDEKLPTPHGNREGLSYGQLSVLLLSYIVTQGDHRLCAVEAWVKQSQKMLERSTGWRISEKEVTDDRLGALVEVFGKQLESREQIELGLGQHLIRAYALPTEVGRCDTSSFISRSLRELIIKTTRPLIKAGQSVQAPEAHFSVLEAT